MMKDIYEDKFQYIELKYCGKKDSNRYKGIPIGLLQDLFGEDWQQIFNHGWNGKADFLMDYKFEYLEWEKNN